MSSIASCASSISQDSSSVMLQKASPSGLHTKMHNQVSFQKLVADTDIYLRSLQQRLIEARADSASEIPYCPNLILRLDKYVMCTIQIGPYDSYISELSSAAVDFMIEHNNEVSHLLSTGINDESTLLAHGKSVYIAKESKSGLDGIITKYTIVKPDVCSKCGLNIVDDVLVDHIKSVECRQAQLRNEIEAAKLVELECDYESEICRTVSIPYEYYPSGFRIYVPTWVDQAIRMYLSMKTRGGFQDMSLSEYLNTTFPKSDD